MAVLALAYVMNQSGQTATLGRCSPARAALFVLLSPVLGWLGVAVTGSDTSSNALFGALQVTAAGKAGLDPVLWPPRTRSGGVMGKMISPAEPGDRGGGGRHGRARRASCSARCSAGAWCCWRCMCVLVYLQSTAVLGWMVP